MLQDEYKWYQLPNYCARASFDAGHREARARASR